MINWFKEALKKLEIKNRKLTISLFLFCILCFILYAVLFQSLGGYFLNISTALQWNAVYILLPIIYSLFLIPVLVLTIKFLQKKFALARTRRSFFQVEAVDWPNSRLILCLAFVAILVLSLYPYLCLHYTFARGIDTSGYIYSLERISSIGFSFSILIGPVADIFSTCIFFFPLNWLGIPWNALFQYIVPVAFGIFYVLVTYFFVKTGTNNKTIAALSALIASVSISTLNLATTLFKNYLALSLLLLFLTFYLQFLSSRQKRYLPLLILINIFLFIQYLPFAVLSIGILAIFLVITLIKERKILRIFAATATIYIPAIAIFLMRDVYNFFANGGKFVKPAFEALPYFLSAYGINISSPIVSSLGLGWIGSFQTWWRYLFVEHFLLLILAIIGILVLCLNIASGKDGDRKNVFFERLVISWLVCLSVLFMFTDPAGQGYRFVLNFPISILSGIAFYFIVEKLLCIIRDKNLGKTLSMRVKRHLFPKYSYSKIVRIALVAILFLSLFTVCLLRYNLNYFYTPYTPSSEVLDSLNFIRDNYKNDSLIFLIDNPHPAIDVNTDAKWMQYFLTTRGMDAQVYIGKLFDLLSGKPSEPIPNQIYSWSSTPAYPNATSYQILTIIPTYSQPDSIENQLLAHVYGQVYTMNKLSPSVIAYWNATWQKYQQTGQVSNVYNDWTEFSPVVVADDGQSDFWSVGAWGSGSIIMPVLSDSSYVKMSCDNSLQIIVNGTNSGYGYWYISHHYELPLNLSGDDFVSYYWYGANTGKTMSIYLRSPDDANFFKVDFLDNFDGWNRLIFSLPAFSRVGSAEWDHINGVRIVCFDKNVSGIWYLDHVILDVGSLEK
jgi:hypothetical protein